MWILRHAQSCSNLVSLLDRGRHTKAERNAFKKQFFEDPDLSDVGREEANRLGKWWESNPCLPKIDRLYTSYALRAVMTAQYMADRMEHPIQIVPVPYCSEIGASIPSSRAAVMAHLTMKQAARMNPIYWEVKSPRRRTECREMERLDPMYSFGTICSDHPWTLHARRHCMVKVRRKVSLETPR